jgi:threonine/homoserine/homoserine lactone efflux protein
MLSALLGFVLGFIGSVPLAGPIAFMVLRKGMLGQFRAGRAVALGGTLAEGIYCLLAVLGMERLLLAYPVLDVFTRWVGALVLMGLGLVFIITRKEIEHDTVKVHDDSAFGGPFLAGFAVSALNPTLLLTWSGAVAAVHAVAGTMAGWHRWLFPVAVSAGVYLWFVLMLAAMRHWHGRFGARTMHQFMRLCGWLLLAAGAVLLVRQWLA